MISLHNLNNIFLFNAHSAWCSLTDHKPLLCHFHQINKKTRSCNNIIIIINCRSVCVIKKELSSQQHSFILSSLNYTLTDAMAGLPLASTAHQQARHQVWANPVTARVAQDTAQVAQLLLKFKILLSAPDHCVS